jgi:O-antigen/teichoic acid export membrane protein
MDFKSIASARLATRSAAFVAAASFLVAAFGWPISLWIFVPAAVLGTTAVLCFAFAWFWLDHLRELEREK